MSLESFFSGQGAVTYLQASAACLSAIGTQGFNTAFLDIIESVIKADQCMIFSYKGTRPECYLSYAPRQNTAALNSAQRYLRDGFRTDPLQRFIEATKGTRSVQVVNLDDLKDEMPPDYRETFFSARGIIDKMSIICSDGQETLVLNFYRFEENGRFAVSDTSLRLPFWTTIAHMALLHFSNARLDDLTSPLNSLSAREKSICEAMLNGMTSEAIAWRLDISPSTVKTYRQRAYAKLGINSKSALFALCRPR